MADLTGRHILITGAAGALGSTVADRARELGARVTLVDIVMPDGANQAEWRIVDLLSQSAVMAALSDVEGIDTLFHLAGGFDMGPAVHELTDENLSSMLAINVTTLLNIARAVIPGMIERGRGSIATVGALSALKGQGRMGAYTAAKSMVMRLTESMSAELRDQGINVNSVLPSIIDTPANRRDMPDAEFDKWVSRRELADVICFLGSDAASAVHGVLMPVAGRI
jgi:NAD(P)-dependent dehydrogenase (short-subunit alcohol dehydrogenase family)